MYEARIIHSGEEPTPSEVAVGGTQLRELSWGDIAARLAAARDFRRLSAAHNPLAGGSFDLSSARHLAALGEGKPAVNPIVLANGKCADGIDFAATSEETHGDRGR
ncbi:hypothetical protein SZ64_13475 [Erythrobacter sp. SG61-1L]|uniref:hypothetical protein n=1 Tax=Erythrobacter sp. SG61-1L TaxID=1603897 RepID=UPI0006C8F683|nr:hypothetical protein [Erythrobacter sp. SG61-1L]KPL69023.1 hypothetical protein SZ64_13475 [Erythrobacter sp. SG61-1L]